ncbi:MAG: hypothetical protein LBP59_01905 [Planctomycetaceae bacterium]|jgi:hypothetical protein|nr:hypothetical protein [Planctomycetaceae bacterium]
MNLTQSRNEIIRQLENHNSEFQPLDEYKNIYKELHQKNVAEYFENLVKESEVNENENRKTVVQINSLKFELDEKKKSLRDAYIQQHCMIFLIVFCVCCGIAAIAILNGAANDTIVRKNWDFRFVQNISIAVIFWVVAFFCLSIFFIVKLIAPKIKELKTNVAELQKQLQLLIDLAWSQMSKLNSLFKRHISSRLMEKTYPLIKFDDYFDVRRFDCLQNKYGLWDNSDQNISTLFTQSGEINGNPFCFFTTLNHYLGSKTYQGSLTVHWTETSRNSDGKLRTKNCSHTLYAEVIKPCPQYWHDSYLIYGNEAAPNLSFSRNATDAEELSEKQLQRKINKGIKNLNAQMQKAVARGENFTSMGNDFDALFNANNRNNEIEFRLLFTPIAQREIIKLLKDTTYSWGDDFEFTKIKMINMIEPEHLSPSKTTDKPEHLQARDITGNPENYIHYNIDEIRENFNRYNNEYFRAVYFAFAPLLAIPLYQQYKPHEFIYKDVYKSHFSCFAHEYAINKITTENFKPEDSTTETIIKTKLQTAENKHDNIQVTAYGYKTIERTDYVPVTFTNGNGNTNTYQIPVNWIEYIPIKKITNTTISENNF